MRARRLIGRIVVAALILVVVVIVLGAAVSRTAAFRDWLRGQVLTRLNAGLNGELTLGRLDGNLIQHLVLTDLRLRSEGRRVLAARRVAARYDLLTLLTGGGLTLRDVEISGLALTVVEDERGWSIARLYPPRPQPEKRSDLEIVLEDARVEGASIKVARRRDVWRLRDLRLAASVRLGRDGQEVAVSELSTTLPGRDVRVAALTGRVAIAADGSLRAEGVQVRTGGSELHADARIPGRDGGSYDVSVEAPHLAADEVRHLVRTRLFAPDFAATFHMRGPASWAAVDGTITSDAGKVALDGHVGLDDPPSYDLRALLTNVNAAGFLGPSQPVTVLTGTAGVKGKGVTLEQAAASAVLALHDSAVSGRAISYLRVDGEIAEQQITFEAATHLEAGEAEASGTVDIAAERYDLQITTSDLDPAPLVRRPDLHAKVNATLALTGTGFHPATARAEAHLAVTPSRVEQVDIRSAKADVRAANGTLAIDALRVDASALQLQASGTLALDAQAGATRGALRYEVRAADLAAVGRIAGVGPLAGSLGIEGTAGGAVGNLQMRATITGRKLARAGTEVGTLTAHVAGDGIGSPRARADVDVHATDVHAAGRRFASTDLQGHWQQQAGARSIANATMHVQEDARHQHELALDAALEPRDRRITIASLHVDLGEETWRSEGTPTITQRGDRVTIERFALRSPRGLVRIDGEAGTSGAQDLNLRVDGVDLAMLAATVQAKVGGRVSANVHLGGSAQAPAIQTHVEVDAPTIEQVRYESAVVDASVASGRAALSARVVQTGARQLTLDASSPVRVTLSPFSYEVAGTLAGTLRASAIDLAFLDPLLPQVSKLAGTLEADLTLAGTIARPEVRGPLAIAGGRAYVVPLGLTYDPIELRMTLEGAAASIETLRIVSGTGTLSGGGSARIDAGGAALDARFQLERFPLFANEFGEGAASGWIWLSGDTAAPVVGGSLTSDRLVLLVPESLPGSARPPDSTVKVIGPAAQVVQIDATPHGTDSANETPAPAALAKPGIYDRAAITVQIDVPRDAWIRRSDTNVELRGWMTAWKKPGRELALAGDIETVRGWYTFQGKTFAIEEGRVTFTGQDFNPVLTLTAVHTAGDYTVRVKIGGTLTTPTLALESDPPLDPADVLSVLVFGKPASRLNSGESAGLREQAIGVASSYVASELRQSVADTLGLDTLQFETGSEGVRGASVSLGKYVAPDVFVSLAHRFAKQGVEEIRIEYAVTPHWSVETSSDTLGDSGIDVFWKNRY